MYPGRNGNLISRSLLCSRIALLRQMYACSRKEQRLKFVSHSVVSPNRKLYGWVLARLIPHGPRLSTLDMSQLIFSAGLLYLKSLNGSTTP
jgi:hypothetical protein